ncbi:MAG: polyprenyl synthetase family protein [Simkaniaceae bacterium]
MKEYREKIDQRLKDHLLKIKNPLIAEMSEYALFSGGKRLRPLLVLAVLEAFNRPIEKGLDAAIALELIHTYSLIHDDLPCMDDDDFRRGLPTLHKKYDEASAVLTGDFLLTFAFDVLSSSSDIEPLMRLKLIKKLAIAGGASGLIGGQLLDLSTSIDRDNFKKIYELKTGALIRCAFEFGALISECGPAAFSEISLIGEKLGLGYQIADDLIDLDDCALFYGTNESLDLIQKIQFEINRSIEKLPISSTLLNQLIHQSLIRHQ